ncbi:MULTISPECIES: 5'-nucleotidase, lipoprotein e(P4) family [Pseudanabaena]|jgi:5'-nucleotidase (lipoprotein e(P4) family)|uniref:5'-nucleotidase, lipoprotein e(P4) family n=1 Tax=Pseudanabaena TaxID=1152 RepID=UPI00247B2107|nr:MULTISPECIES: 5'-nucleotidase, lipoprotein e(P4) family [Pseudanabaena]MEA5487475.1 5'-nucleotidase, lipoprotein e(P4) family [Pseudanabaena sp. CCNP1317]WGS74048.1 5'-nucleotidase, lipoprotein e(P4) family [Pseudanabaena galeata CCNP1313]
MKKLLYSLTMFIALLSISFSAIAYNPKAITQLELNNQSILAVNWMQQSGEYQALAYQAFNIAKVAFNTALVNGISEPAVIVDLDETILDNSPYQASLIGSQKGFESKTWDQWIKAEQTLAIPGAIDFINYINTSGGKVFFVSNRGVSSGNSKINDLEISTKRNMLRLGFEGVNEQTLLLKGEFTKTINGRNDTSKQWRIDAVSNGKVDGINHNVVIFIGDNLNDFADISKNDNTVRKEFVAKTQKQQGILVINPDGFQPAYVTLPNPIYGDWENGLYNPQKFNKKNHWDLSPSQKFMQRLESLIKWKG